MPAAVSALAAALHALPVVRATGLGAPRFVRLRFDVTMYGIAGHGEIVADRVTGRFVRRIDAGPASEREGFDGVRAWRADATGTARVQGNADQRGAIAIWAALVARAAPPAHIAPGRRSGTARIRLPGVAQDVTLAFDSAARVAQAVRRSGEDVETTTFGDYRRSGAVSAPYRIDDTSESGTWSAQVRAIATPSRVADATFAPPPPPNDATLAAPTTVPLSAGMIVDAQIDDGPPLRFLLDTGGQNALSPDAAQRLGLRRIGDGTVAGAGASLARVAFTTVARVRVGAAELRDQPFLVLPFGAVPPFDGILGYELFARFAARIDPLAGTLTLAPSGDAFRGEGVAVPMRFNDRQPEVDGAIDGIPAVLAIDTGSSDAVDVYAPFVRAHRLVERYPVTARETLFVGVGGAVQGWLARARRVRLGSVDVEDVRLALTDADAGAENNPSIAANVGDAVLSRFVLTLDYRAGLLRLAPASP